MLSLLWCSSFLSSSLFSKVNGYTIYHHYGIERRNGMTYDCTYYKHPCLRTSSPVFLHATQPSSAASSSSPSSSSTATASDTTAESQRMYDKKNEELSSSSLSDVDTRVLQSMLQDPQFIDSIMKDTIQQYLSNDDDDGDQGNTRRVNTGPSSASSASKQQQQQKQQTQSSSSEYASTFFKSMEKLTESSSLFNSIKAKADEFIGSLQILVSNRVERDLTLLTSLSVFAWQRIVKDVARALPASGRSSANMAKKMRDALFQLTSNSSYVPYTTSSKEFLLPPSKYSQQAQQQRQQAEEEEWNSPLDEIKVVTAQIQDILQGKTVLSVEDLNPRGLKSVVPAGSTMNTERQRRAYLRRKEQINNRQRDSNIPKTMGRVVSTVSDTVWELNRELQAQGNDPGYRVETFVRNIQGSTSDPWIKKLGSESSSSKKYAFFLDDPDPMDDDERDLDRRTMNSETTTITAKFNNNNNKEEMKYSSSSSSGMYDHGNNRLSLSTLQDERTRFTTGIRLCLEQPQNTWLVPELIQAHVQQGLFKDKDTSTKESIENVISTMTFIRDSVEADMEQCESETDDTYNETRRIIEFKKLRQMLDSIVSLAAAAVGSAAADRLRDELMDKDSTVDLLESILERRDKEKEEEKRRWYESSIRNPKVSFVDMDLRDNINLKPTIVLDAVVERNNIESGNTVPFSPDWDTLSVGDVQVLSDDDDDYTKILKLKKTTRGLDTVSEKVENPAIAVTLRVFDILFFVLEKTITLGLPPMVTLSGRIQRVVDNIQRKGMGKSGWEMLRNLKKSKYVVDK